MGFWLGLMLMGEAKRRRVLVGIERKGMGSYYLMGRKFQFEVMRKFWRGWW